MHRFTRGARAVAPMWGWMVATCLVGVAAIFGLGTVAPVVMEGNLVGLTLRTAVCALCMAGFVATASRG